MQLDPYLDRVRDQAAQALVLADEPTRAMAERLLGALDAPLRLTLLELVADVAAQVTASLDGDVVQVHLVHGDPDIRVGHGLASPPPATPSTAAPDADDAGTARVSLRLPESLKQQADDAASSAGVSLNTWLVRAVRTALSPAPRPSNRSTGRVVTGWA